MENINMKNKNEEMINYIIERGAEEYSELVEEANDAGNNDEIYCRVGGEQYDLLCELSPFIVNNDMTSQDSLTPRARKIFAKWLNKFELDEVNSSLQRKKERDVSKFYREIKDEEQFVAQLEIDKFA